jgi:hypothetical protein
MRSYPDSESIIGSGSGYGTGFVFIPRYGFGVGLATHPDSDMRVRRFATINLGFTYKMYHHETTHHKMAHHTMSHHKMTQPQNDPSHETTHHQWSHQVISHVTKRLRSRNVPDNEMVSICAKQENLS